MTESANIDRVSICRYPGGWPIMYQTWNQLLFLHWPVQPEQIRPLVPAELEIDTWEGMAWIGITPFAIERARPVLAPPLPLVSSSLEINVRTYVHHDGVPGVWFLSLDASNPLAVWGARLAYLLPYYQARMELQAQTGRLRFRSVRRHPGAAQASFQASWRLGSRMPTAVPGTRDFFLIERYCLYSGRAGRLYRARIAHVPWPLSAARVEDLSSTMLESQGISSAVTGPLIHAQAEPLRVAVWPPWRL